MRLLRRPTDGSRLSHAEAAPFFAQKGPALVVSPLAAQLEVANGETFSAKTKASHQRDGTRVLGLDVGLNPVEAELPEGSMKDKRQACGHEALP